MMMQTEPSGRLINEGQADKRPDASARHVAGVLLVGLFAALLAALLVSAAHAEKAIARLRPRPRQALVTETEHAKARSRAGKSPSSKTGLAKRGSAKGSDEAARAVPRAVKPQSRGKLHGRRRAEPAEEETEPVVMHRAASLKSGKAAGGGVQPALRLAAHGHAVQPARDTAAGEDVVAQAKALTSDDFVRAAGAAAEDVSAANGKAYVRGESHTEVDDRDSDEPAVISPRPRILALKPVVKKPVIPVARMEANPPVGGLTSAPSSESVTMVTPTEDLTGQPLVSSVDGPPARGSSGKNVIAPLPPLSRLEVTEEVEQPVLLPGLYRNGRLVMPAPLKGTHEILVHQNLMADDEGLERIEDDYDLRRLRAAHLLVDYPESASLHINPELAADRRCGRVWSVKFATNIARDFYARFHQPLQVNSAVRTVAFQVRLQRTNGNAAGIDGETASPHLTGQAMDLGKRNMSMAQIAWMRAYLLPLMQAGKVDVEEEFQQACFHISVYRSYMPVTPKRHVQRTEVAQLRVPRVKAASRGDELR